jgi:hypothetical protein
MYLYALCRWPQKWKKEAKESATVAAQHRECQTGGNPGYPGMHAKQCAIWYHMHSAGFTLPPLHTAGHYY